MTLDEHARTNLAGWDAPTERSEIPYVDQYDANARRLLRL